MKQALMVVSRLAAKTYMWIASGKQLGLFAIALSVSCLAAVPHAKATLITYVIAANSTFDFGISGGGLYSISGQFTVDLTVDGTQAPTNASYTLSYISGPIVSGLATTFNANQTLVDTSDPTGAAIFADPNNLGDTMDIGFTNIFTFPTNPTISSLSYRNSNNVSFVAFSSHITNVSISETSSTSAPEPASLALLLSGLFGLRMIRKRRS